MIHLLQAQGGAVDTGIHLTISGAIVALIVEKIWDKMNSNKDSHEVRDALREQTEILTRMDKNIEILKDRRFNAR